MRSWRFGEGGGRDVGEDGRAGHDRGVNQDRKWMERSMVDAGTAGQALSPRNWSSRTEEGGGWKAGKGSNMVDCACLTSWGEGGISRGCDK